MPAVLGMLAAGCGAAPPAALTQRAPWTPELVDVFDDAVDFVAPRAVIDTPWFDEYSAQVERRSVEADFIVVVELQNISWATESVPFTVIDARVRQSLKGGLAVDRVIPLHLASGTEAHRLFEEQLDRTRAQEGLLAYVRVYEDSEGLARTHWHLSPADAELIGIVSGRFPPPPPEGGGRTAPLRLYRRGP